MLLRGITLDDAVYQFELVDCPVLINDGKIALTNQKNSPLLRANSLARGSEELGVFENDFIMDENFKYVGIAFYNKGFKVLKSNGEVVTLSSLKNFLAIPNFRGKGIELTRDLKSFISFRFEDIVFTTREMIRVEGNLITIYTKLLKNIYLNDTKMCTDFTKDNEPICFGDIINGGEVVMLNGDVVIKQSNGAYKEIEE